MGRIAGIVVPAVECGRTNAPPHGSARFLHGLESLLGRSLQRQKRGPKGRGNRN